MTVTTSRAPNQSAISRRIVSSYTTAATDRIRFEEEDEDGRNSAATINCSNESWRTLDCLRVFSSERSVA